jgi:cobalt-zinc-cadmium efflux system outer membrane protein
MVRAMRVVGALCFQLSTPRALGSQTTTSVPDPREVVAIALRHNPDILAARLRIDSAAGEQRIARAIPNPVVNSAPNQPWQYTVTMPLDVTPQRFLRTRAAARASDAALSDAADVVRQVTFAVRQAYVDVLLADQQRELATERRDIFRQLLAADSARLRAGDIPQRDVVKAELELARAEADRMRADAQVHAARLALQLLMGVGTQDTAFTVAGDLTYAPVEIPTDSLGALTAERPDVRAAHARLEQSGALRSMASSLWIPLPELTYSYQHGGQFARGDLFTNGSSSSIGFGFTFPLFYWNGGERQRSAAGLEQAAIASRRVEVQVANDVATALDSYNSARNLAERYESGLLAKARGVLETARYAYGTGAISLLELQDAISTWSDTRSDYLTAVHDYWVSVYALSRAVGRDLVP